MIKYFEGPWAWTKIIPVRACWQLLFLNDASLSPSLAGPGLHLSWNLISLWVSACLGWAAETCFKGIQCLINWSVPVSCIYLWAAGLWYSWPSISLAAAGEDQTLQTLRESASNLVIKIFWVCSSSRLATQSAELGSAASQPCSHQTSVIGDTALSVTIN